jgi:hypothetical protein
MPSSTGLWLAASRSECSPERPSRDSGNIIEDALLVSEDNGIEEHRPPDPGREPLRQLLNDPSAKTLPNKTDLLEVVLLNVGRPPRGRSPGV